MEAQSLSKGNKKLPTSMHKAQQLPFHVFFPFHCFHVFKVSGPAVERLTFKWYYFNSFLYSAHDLAGIGPNSHL